MDNDDNLKRSHKFHDYLLPGIFLVGFLILTGYLVITRVIPATNQAKVALSDLKNQIIENQNISKEAVDALNKKPPEHSDTGLVGKTVGQTTAVSEGGQISQAQIDKLNQLSGQTTSATTPMDLTITDTTGRFGQLITPLKTYMSTSLLWTNRELPSLHEIRLVNAGDSGWSGMYNGGYTTLNGRINSVSAWIDLNVYYYQDSPYILEYLQLTVSHEYGHHYTLYNKWLTNQIPYGSRFPDAYYSTRPLSYTTTAADYSKGWANCDAEIMAEDYKYLFSPYKNQQMAATYGYPSDPATRNYLLAFGNGSQTADTTAPSVSIVSPAVGATVSSTIQISAQASDNVAVAGVNFYLNDQDLGQTTKSGQNWVLSFNSKSRTNDSYNLRARACDQANNCTNSSTVTITINNVTADTTPPQVTITSPSDGQTVSGTITFSANVSDNVRVDSAEFFLDSQSLVRKTIAPYSVEINTLSYSNSPHTMKVVASDGLNQTTESISITVANSGEADTEKPTVSITAPSTNPYTWSSGNLIVTTLGHDNVGVVKIEFYINDTLVATENSSSISRRWLSSGTPAGSYELKAIAYDAAGNTGESSIVINKQ